MNVESTFATRHPVALVTGSGSPRVGRTIAERLASIGCHIVLHWRREDAVDPSVAESIRTNFGVDVSWVVGDVREPDIATQWTDKVVQQFGRLDILVNSAAIWFPTPLGDITEDEMSRYFEINTVAPFMLARAASQAMVKNQRGGAVVNLGDWATVRPYIDHAAYFPSKFAIEGVTKSLAVELAQRHRDIRVNCVRPGPVLMADDVAQQTRQKLASATLVGRIGTPQAIAHAVEFLCLNDFTTGICLDVDGGRSVYSPDGLQVGMNTG